MFTANLLYVHVIGDDYKKFNERLREAPSELGQCHKALMTLRDPNLMRRFCTFIGRVISLAIPASKLVEKIEYAIRQQHPQAHPGSQVSIWLGTKHLEVTVGNQQSFAGMTVNQIARNLQEPLNQVEKQIFKVQLNDFGTQPQNPYLKPGVKFSHPLAEIGTYPIDNPTGLNTYSIACNLINAAYLVRSSHVDTEQEIVEQLSIHQIESFLGTRVTAEETAKLKQRHLPTIYSLCSRLVESME